MRRFLRNNGLSLVLFLLFFAFLIGQSLTGRAEYNDDQRDHHQPTVGYTDYLTTGHFLEATMENWESEFLQMFAFIVLTMFLYQKGSAESKDPDGDNEVDQDPRLSKDKRDAPWPVRKGGLVLKVYENSLALAFLLLFLMSFALHAVGGASDYNREQAEHGSAERVTTIGYAETSRFWFESLENWQSEFLAIFCMVVFTIRLRQKGSPESKPVDAPHSKTGE